MRQTAGNHRILEGKFYNAENATEPDSHGITAAGRRTAENHHHCMTRLETKRRQMTNDKLNQFPDNVWGIVLTAAAALLCVAIDVVLKEETHDNSASRTRESTHADEHLR